MAAKSKQNAKIIFLTTTILCLAGFLAWFLALKPKDTKEDDKNVSENNQYVDNNSASNTLSAAEEEQMEPRAEDIEHQLAEAGYIAYWDYQGGINRYQDQAQVIEEVLPNWYSIDKDGHLKGKTAKTCDSSLVSQVHQNDDRILPSVSNPSASELSDILSSPTLTSTLINGIIKEVDNCKFDGIDIDFEKISSNDKEKFSEFICELAKELHKDNKLLSIAILPRIENSAQDWRRLGSCVDEFKIMAYDFTKSSDEAGPNTPNYWLEDIVEYAVENVPKDKIQIGLPLYAYIWEKEKEGTKIVKMKWELETMFDNEARKLISNALDKESGEKLLIYEKAGKEYLTYWNDDESLEHKKEILKKFGIETVFYWRL